MLDIVRRIKLILRFISARRADYAELASLEWAQLSHSVVLLVFGAVAATLSMLFFLGFLSFAVVVSAWESEWRALTAWLVALVWLGLTAAGGALGWSASRNLHPFQRVRKELGEDVAVVRTVL